MKGQLILGNCRDDIDDAQSRVLDVVRRCGYDNAALFAVRVAVEEALANAVQHGNGNDPDKTVKLGFAVDPSSVVIDVHDEGQGFNPEAVPDPTRAENVDIPSGRGIMLMRSYMSSVEFHAPGNHVRMIYKRA